MTTRDIIRIALHVAIVQAIADLAARKLVFAKESYKRACSNLERMRAKRDKILASGKVESTGTSKSAAKAADRANKKVQRAETDYGDAVAEVSKLHAVPSMITSVMFLILYQVLQSEYSGKVVAILPFTPFSIVQSITRRGLPKLSEMQAVEGVDPSRCCGFLFVYMLSTLSVKFIVSKVTSVQAPEGVEGISSMLESPRAQKIMEKLGVDPDEILDARDAAKSALGG